MKKVKIQPGSQEAGGGYYVTVLEKGPYLVYGRPPMNHQIIVENEGGMNWNFAEGVSFSMAEDPVAICRCGSSENKPYCDGAHLKADWDAELSASEDPILEDAETFEGPKTGVSLTDNIEYCVFARFCDAEGRVWKLVGKSDNPKKREHTIHEANMCPGARLSAWDNQTQKPFEPKYDPSLALIEDQPLKVSGGLWVRGGIPIKREDGFTYEIRNRVVLCRCGESTNKPYCDGTHATMRFKDGLYDYTKK